jgi:hypothetical protein
MKAEQIQNLSVSIDTESYFSPADTQPESRQNYCKKSYGAGLKNKKREPTKVGSLG